MKDALLKFPLDLVITNFDLLLLEASTTLPPSPPPKNGTAPARATASFPKIAGGRAEPCGFTTRWNEYADDVNRACGDGRELIYCVYERANVS